MVKVFLTQRGDYPYKELLMKSLVKGDVEKIKKFVKLKRIIPLDNG